MKVLIKLKKRKKYKLNNEQKKAFEYLDLVNNKFDVSVFKEQLVQERH